MSYPVDKNVGNRPSVLALVVNGFVTFLRCLNVFLKEDEKGRKNKLFYDKEAHFSPDRTIRSTASENFSGEIAGYL